jgi:glycosyltransferase involved in cell wall biosynthesis
MSLRIGLIATHSFPISPKDPEMARRTPHTGDIVILDLAHGLKALGHEVTLFAPEGTDWPNLVPMRCSWGKWPPGAEECERSIDRHALFAQDIVHDFSVTKASTLIFSPPNVVHTLMGGPWLNRDKPPRNLCVWSDAHRDRVLRGATDYEGTPTPDLGGPPGVPVKDAHVVYGGVDTDFYCPSDYAKDDYFLWLNRWHPAKGYKQAIDLAKRTGIRLVVAGEHPDDLLFAAEKACAAEAHTLCQGFSNITLEWLPRDPEHHLAKRELYRGAQALLYPVQFQEPFGLSMVEAMACGTPVAHYGMGSCGEVVGPCGAGFQCHQVESNVGVFIRIIPDADSCRERVKRMFSREAFAKRYEREYRNVLEGRIW